MNFSYRTFSSGLPSVRDGRLSRSPFIALVGNEFVTVAAAAVVVVIVVFDVFEDDESDGSVIVVGVNGDGCSGNALDDVDDGGSKSALGTEFEPS